MCHLPFLLDKVDDLVGGIARQRGWFVPATRHNLLLGIQLVRAVDRNYSKGKAAKPNEFGKMVKLQEAENQIVIFVIDYEVYDQRPNDADLLLAGLSLLLDAWPLYSVREGLIPSGLGLEWAR